MGLEVSARNGTTNQQFARMNRGQCVPHEVSITRLPEERAGYPRWEVVMEKKKFGLRGTAEVKMN